MKSDIYLAKILQGNLTIAAQNNERLAYVTKQITT